MKFSIPFTPAMREKSGAEGRRQTLRLLATAVKAIEPWRWNKRKDEFICSMLVRTREPVDVSVVMHNVVGGLLALNPLLPKPRIVYAHQLFEEGNVIDITVGDMAEAMRLEY